MNESYALTEAAYYILLSLCAPLHGYGVMQQVLQLSGGRVQLAAGTLYGALGNLCSKGWIAAVPGDADGRRKEYVITPNGKHQLEAELARLHELVSNGEKILGESEING